VNYDKVKQAVLTDEPQGAWGRNIFDYSTRAEEAQRVVDTFHARSLTPSTAWPHHIDLSKHQTLLDVGGASGAHAMGAAAVWPNLTALVLDFEPVCRAAEPVIARHGLAGRVRTHAADMFHDPYPPADVHFYSNVLHDWPPERGKFLLDKSFAALPPGGLVILHEMLFNDDKTGPPGVASLNLDMLNGMLGQQFTGAELTRMLEDAGFVNVTTTATFAYYSIVVGEKR
jgi:cyclopropane fatty-acyl-phospholipid synthase-like methyltransferase